MRNIGGILLLILGMISFTGCTDSDDAHPLTPSQVINVTGTWWLPDRSQGSYVLEQNGNAISGVFRSGISNTEWPLEGTINGDNLTFTKHMAYYDGVLTGTVSTDGRTITGNGVSYRTVESDGEVPAPYEFVLTKE